MGSLDDYRMGKKIGEGSFGKVFLCTSKRTKEKLVMKRMRLNNVPSRFPSLPLALCPP